MFAKLITYKAGLAAFCLTVSVGLVSSLPVFAEEDISPVNAVDETTAIEETSDVTTDEVDVVEGAATGEEPLNTSDQMPDTPEGSLSEATELEETELEETAPDAVEENSPDAESDVQGIPVEASDDVLYQDLQAYLSEQSWEEADHKTFDVLLTLVGATSAQQGYFATSEWDDFIADPEKNCPNVRRIDNMWREASGNILGFGAQKILFDEVQRVPSSFYARIGWLNGTATEEQVDWEHDASSTSAEEAVTYVKKPLYNQALSIPGHLPAIMYWEGDVDKRLQLFFTCNLPSTDT